MYLPNYGLRKTWLHNCLKSPVLEDPLTRSMLNGPKHCCNLNESTFTILIDIFQSNLVGKSLSWIYAKS